MWCLKYKRELALSLMISACLSSSVLAQGASDSFATAAQKSLPKTIASKSKAALNISDSSTPEAGVQVLTEILHLLESKGTLVAMKPQMVASADLPNSAPNMFQQQLMNSPRQSDPANLIRPPAKKSAAKSSSMVAGKLLSRPSSAAGGAPLIAMNNKQSSEFSKAGFGYYSNQADVTDSRESKGLQVHAKARAASYQQQSGVAGDNAYAPAPSEERFARLRKSIGKLYQATDSIDRIQQIPQTRADEADDTGSSGIAADKKVTVISGPTRAKNLVSPAGSVFEYGAMQQQMAQAERLKSEEPAAKDMEQKPDGQPTAYRTTKEYQARRAMPQQQQIAFLPPSMPVAGIDGLPLGSNEAQVRSFLQGKGAISKKVLKDWTVYSLINSETKKASLQIYLRRGSADAIRVFDDDYVPENLGVNLMDDLQKVKKKFGEADWMPKIGTSKNYIYSINQVSFQIGPESEKSKKKVVQNVLLFQFL